MKTVVYILTIAIVIVLTTIFSDVVNPLSEKNISRNTKCYNLSKATKEIIEVFISFDKQRGQVLRRALKENPKICVGKSWVLGPFLNDVAMTVDNIIVVKDMKDMSIYLLVHELVHVYQYKKLGKNNFLRIYFGETLGNYITNKFTFFYRANKNLNNPLKDMLAQSKKNLLERHADDIDEEFSSWTSNEGIVEIRNILRKHGLRYIPFS